ncbi:MAG: hypothetical protein JSW52_08780 [Candidatus Coatesbacteria bacterium]|nr:MAG: hypothetical protein JSW52_08780 [Candidatus Coatesbacteria bacterium]
MRTLAITLLTGSVFLSFTACDNGGSTTPTFGNTPAQVLEALERAFRDRDAELLDGLLDTDFTFHFDENDIGKDVGGYTIPESWDKENFLAACEKMFDDAYSIDLTVSTENVGEPDDGATAFTAENVPVNLLVMVDATNGYLAAGFCDFVFVNDDSAGYDDWSISDWWDKTAGGGTLSITGYESLGVILANFYE